MIEILFILGFSLHNIEEALWLPEWRNDKKVKNSCGSSSKLFIDEI